MKCQCRLSHVLVCHKLSPDQVIVCIISKVYKTPVPAEAFGASITMEAQCEGNPDEKFIPLVEKCDGVFKDPSGRQYVC